MRAFRSYRSMARVRHWCDYCCTDILPGSEYEAVVYATQKRRLIVYKCHIHPACEWPEDPSDEERVPVIPYVKRIRMAA